MSKWIKRILKNIIWQSYFSCNFITPGEIIFCNLWQAKYLLFHKPNLDLVILNDIILLFYLVRSEILKNLLYYFLYNQLTLIRSIYAWKTKNVARSNFRVKPWLNLIPWETFSQKRHVNPSEMKENLFIEVFQRKIGDCRRNEF